MDIGIARTFLEVVKTGSFVRAAENLNLTQTAVSARIRVLASGISIAQCRWTVVPFGTKKGRRNAGPEYSALSRTIASERSRKAMMP